MAKRNSPEHFWDFVDKKSDDECWEWLGSHCSRYGRFRYDGKKITAHKFSYFLFTGYMPSSTEYVCHKCDNIYCVNPHHLFLGTQFDNMQDMVRKGRNFDTKGENNGRCVISKDDVIKIRKLRLDGLTYLEIQKQFPIRMTQIGRIIRNESWVWVE